MIKIQGLAVIAIIILLPMTLILSSYISSQAKTLGYQVEYDSRLQNSTYDALKAFQMNTANSDTSDIANSKIRDVKAGANSFFESLANNFNMPGYNKETLAEYVPAVVFTMYDGYYIYSPYENTMEQSDAKKLDDTVKSVLGSGASDKDIKDYEDENLTYYNGQELSGLKPYVYYSARYKKDSDGLDVTITYSLDNYIVIHGKGKNKFNGGQEEAIDISGYLLTNVKYNGPDYANTGKPGSSAIAEYRGIPIRVETNYKERTFISKQAEYNDIDPSTPITKAVSERAVVPCRMINGVRYYNTGPTNNSGEFQSSSGNSQGIWALLNGSWREQNYLSETERERGELDLDKVKSYDVNYNSNAVEYYKDAVIFKDEIQQYEGLENLKIGDMIINNENAQNQSYQEYVDNHQGVNDTETLSYLGNPTDDIFKSLGTIVHPRQGTIDIEEPESNFNEHRLGVIRYAVEKNLSNAINNFNKYSDSSTEFQMPKLSEEEWSMIYDNLCVMTFLQGLNIGGKVYNGHAVIPNTDNKEVVTEDSIYIVGKNKENGIISTNYNRIYKATYNDIDVFDFGNDTTYARWKMDFKRSSTEDLNNGTVEYFYRYPEECNFIDNSNNPTYGNAQGSTNWCFRYGGVNNSNNVNKQSGEKDDVWYAYDSIVTTEGNNILGSENTTETNMYDYMENMYNNGNQNLAIAYFTALARTRWGMYRVENTSFVSAIKQDNPDPNPIT